MLPRVPANWALQLLAGNLFLLAWFHASLTLAQKRERFVQTASAIFVVSAVFVPVLLPLLSGLQPYLADPDNTQPPPGLVLLPAAGFTIWLLAIEVWIVRCAFEWPIFRAVLYILAQNFASAWLLGLLFATPGNPA
jgi:hypothetical protein